MKRKVTIIAVVSCLVATTLVVYFVGCGQSQSAQRSETAWAVVEDAEQGAQREVLSEPTRATGPVATPKPDCVVPGESTAVAEPGLQLPGKAASSGPAGTLVTSKDETKEIAQTTCQWSAGDPKSPTLEQRLHKIEGLECVDSDGRFKGKEVVIGDKPIMRTLFKGRPSDPNSSSYGGYALGSRGSWNGDTAGSAPFFEGGERSAGVRRVRKEIPADLLTVTADEVWVIVQPEAHEVAPDEDTPGCGAMLAKLPAEEKEIPLPLKHTDVQGQISGYIAAVEVTQQFHNPYDEKIEAVYVFPLPQNAAINEFIMTIGERRIRGIIRERREAERIYQEARAQGHVASLLTQERPNIFTQKVANIEPGKEIDVNIRYFNTLAYVDGWYEFVFPMVVGPRFNPPGYTDGVGAVARGKDGISGQKTEVQYLKPGERSGHDISVSVDIDAGVAIEEVVCTNHAVTNDTPTSEKRTITLCPLDSIPNKDFVLRYKVAGKRVKSALVTHEDERGGFFTLMLYPPENLNHLRRAPMEMIFVLDCSGSMRGKPIAKAKDAIKRALKKLEADDTFQVIRFSNNASQLGPAPIPATAENIRKALQYVESLEGSGGTMMIEGIKAALDFEHDPRRFRLVSFMTDGYIGNEVQILAAIHEKLGESRIFSFGVGKSVNRYLLDRMAKLGKGAVAYISLDESAGQVVDLFYERISHPALTDIAIDWGDMQVSEIYPRRIPDLFVGRPVIITGRYSGTPDRTIYVSGKVGGLTQDIAIPVDPGDAAATHPGIACVWARKRIEDLGNQATYDSNPDLPGEIKQVALEYGLMSAYTAFVAVDSSHRTSGDHGVTVAVPVPVPDGVLYETTVQEN